MRGASALHALACLTGLGRPDTQTSPEEREVLVRFAEGRKRAVEIGVFEGANTASIAAALAPGGVLFAVDPFPTGAVGVCWGAVIARTHVRREGVADRVRFLEAMSWDAAKLLEGQFDFLFLDGDHGLEAVRRDWQDWSGRISGGGIFALHDTQPEPGPEGASAGSQDYFHSTIKDDPRFETVEIVHSLSVLRRRP